MPSKRAATEPVPIPLDDAIGILREAVQQRDFAIRKIAVGVEVARLSGATWDQIGMVVGLSRQGAHEAFSRRPMAEELRP